MAHLHDTTVIGCLLGAGEGGGLAADCSTAMSIAATEEQRDEEKLISCAFFSNFNLRGQDICLRGLRPLLPLRRAGPASGAEQVVYTGFSGWLRIAICCIDTL